MVITFSFPGDLADWQKARLRPELERFQEKLTDYILTERQAESFQMVIDPTQD